MAFVPKNICTHNTEQKITALKTFTEGLRACKAIVADSYELSDGTPIKPTPIENMYKNDRGKIVIGHGAKSLTTTDDILLGNDFIEFQKPVRAAMFEGAFAGDGRHITNLNGGEVAKALSADNNFFRATPQGLSLILDETCPLHGTPSGLSIDFHKCPTSHDPREKDYILVLTSSGIKKMPVASFLGLVGELNNRVVTMVNNGSNLGDGSALFKGTQVKGRNRTMQFKTLRFDKNFVVEETENEILVSAK
jgi:hypothetical protein